ncbi:ABC transporter permease [Komagataeibacter swingsii]|uniref:Diguanylate cyclase n=1 Tax=Komagataeibacter swingsii TaxID=215220 RepID=A0A2V4SAV1_9PROT|nr:ABC transporter permease [Komagataeibacter swingsii]PYD69078.1 diguanylate cyclase [Komagataeibacter swingsii]GBQ65879.1 dipeptide/oligopeptide/nickel ABC transporter permease [Komagataeibacter swingsii DSM 16373]
MLRSVLRHIAGGAGLLVAVSITGFILLRLAPGGPLAQFALAPGMTQERLQTIAHQMGLDRPLWRQYLHWFNAILHGDWGRSYRDQQPVTHVIAAHLGATAELVALVIAISFPIGAMLGLWGALTTARVVDRIISVATMVCFSAPTFWIGLVLIYVFSIRFGLLPAGGMAAPGASSVMDHIRHLVLPVSVLVTVTVPVWCRYMRAFAEDVLRHDYVRTGMAMGLPAWRVYGRHVLGNAMLPMISVLGTHVPALLGGTLVTETVFIWPGIGRLFLDSLQYRDYPVVMGILMSSAICVIVAGLIAELCYRSIDSRLAA